MRAHSRAILLLSAALLVFSGCRQDMHNQPRVGGNRSLRASDFFADGRSQRDLPHGVVARGQLREDTYFYTGKVGANVGTVFPMPVTREVLDRGEQRFNVYCTPCHSALGNARGMIVQRGFKEPTSFHDERLRNAPVGHFFDVVTNGFGSMPDYASQITPADRWAVIAYIRALQLSQNASLSEVPAAQRGNIGPAQPAPQLEVTPPRQVTEPADGGKTQQEQTQQPPR
ncbi:MAG: cytochrome c [Acidobacteriales bacterium]|nr:cytochrome c [Terriglobales bacterium]